MLNRQIAEAEVEVKKICGMFGYSTFHTDLLDGGEELDGALGGAELSRVMFTGMKICRAASWGGLGYQQLGFDRAELHNIKGDYVI